jgi:DNA-directed RNA polymerase subunit omega
MARITIEDCLPHVNNRFELVLIAAKRSQMLSKNPSLAFVAWEHDKPPVVALREIAAGKVNAGILDAHEADPFEEIHEEVQTNTADDSPLGE